LIKEPHVNHDDEAAFFCLKLAANIYFLLCLADKGVGKAVVLCRHLRNGAGDRSIWGSRGPDLRHPAPDHLCH
jgi:hypothetical protein